jgi:hypothetical protein
MKTDVDLTGQVFGQWTVDCRDPDPGYTPSGLKRRGAWWLVTCFCGTENSLRTDTLVRGKSQQCSNCYREERIKNMRSGRPKGMVKREFINLSGQMFGPWTVKSFDPSKSGVRRYWVCVCKCGKERSISTGELKNTIWRYGCHECYIRAKTRPEMVARRVAEFVGKQFGRWTVESLHSREPVKGYRWNVRCECGNTSVVGSTPLTKGMSTQCHSCGVKYGKPQGKKVPE